MTYLQLFSKTLLEMEYTVFTFCQTPQILLDWVTDHAPNLVYRLKVFKVELPSVPKLPILGKLPNTTRMIVEWQYAAKVIQQVCKQYDCVPDLVFFAWLDSYLSPYLTPLIVDRIFPYPWSGLYFTPPHLKEGQRYIPILNKPTSVYNLLHSSQCQGIGLLDDLEVKKLQSQFDKPIQLFPDLTDETPPDRRYEVTQHIRKQANGRTVIALLGGLSRRKGLMTLLQVAQQTTADNYFFVFAGQLYEHDFSTVELSQIKDFIASEPKHCFFHLKRIPTEAQFNSLVNTCDILFAAYENFPFSSNLITKAAVFEKPIIVSEGYCMAARVNLFQMGIAVPEGSISHCTEAINKLQALGKNDSFSKPNFAGYRKMHSQTRLREAFNTLLKPIQKNPKILSTSYSQ